MLVLITGASGSIGKKLTNKMQNSGYRLRILTRKNNANESSSNIEYVKGDLEDQGSLDKATAGIDAVIHLAGITHTNDRGSYFRINTEGTKNLIKACQNNNVKRFIYISSRSACPEGGAYAESKYLAENFLEKTSLDWTILRPAEVYGTKEKEAISGLINIVRKNPFVPVIGNGQYLLSPIYVDDVIVSIIAALKTNASIKKTYIISGPEELTYNNLIDKISRMLGARRIKIPIPVAVFKLLAVLFYFFGMNILVRDQIPRLLCKKSADISPARRDLDFNPMPIEEGIKILISSKK